MELGEYHFRRGDTLFFVDVDRNAASVVRHGNRVVHVNGAFHEISVARQRLVH